MTVYQDDASYLQVDDASAVHYPTNKFFRDHYGFTCRLIAKKDGEVFKPFRCHTVDGIVVVSGTNVCMKPEVSTLVVESVKGCAWKY